MLSFVDQSANIKVFRVSNGANGSVTRERLGIVKKKDFTLDESLDVLSEDEKQSIAMMVEFYGKGQKFGTLSALYSMPETLRKVVDYVTEEGSRFERDMLLMALVEAMRTLKKAERQEGVEG